MKLRLALLRAAFSRKPVYWAGAAVWPVLFAEQDRRWTTLTEPTRLYVGDPPTSGYDSVSCPCQPPAAGRITY